jgi:peptide/nickel transport system substrate-binding protein
MKRLCIIIMIMLLLVIFCAKQEEKLAGEQGGTLVIGATSLPAAISPLSPSMFGSNEVLDLLFLHLHQIDAQTGKMKPELASSWEFSEDLTSITYYLRTDVTWWDGQPVTAADVYYTYEQMKDPKTNYPDIARLRFIKDVEVIGPYAIRFTFDKVYADILTDSDIMAVPKHIYEIKGDAFAQAPVGNGPYKIKDWRVGSGLVLEANTDYFRGKPPLDEIHIRYYSDVTAMVDDFKAGNLDMVLKLTPESAKALQQDDNFAIDSKPGNTYTYIGWNLRHDLLKDKEIRKALTMAINTQRLLNDVFSGMGTISLGPLPPTCWGYTDKITPVQYNLAEAKKIFEKKGFQDQNRNNIFDKERQDLVLTVITNKENPERVKILELVASDLQKLGVRVNARTLDTRAFIQAIVAGDFDGYIMGWSVSGKLDPTTYWNSDPAKGRFNFVSYSNPVVDSLIDLGVAMLNRTKAQEVWSEFQRIVYEDLPYTFLIVANDISGAYKRVKNMDEGIQLASAYTYWIPESERRVAVASLPPADTTEIAVVSPEKPEITEGRPAGTETKPVETPEKPPEIVKPEEILEAVAKKETTAVAVAPPDTTPVVVPPEPPKPSVITQAKPIKQVNPSYPESARAVGATGRIVVRVTVGTDGKVVSATILSSFGNPACEAAALSSAKKWEFSPATKDGVPFEQKISIPFNFKP